jgi:hypothetical protein
MVYILWGETIEIRNWIKEYYGEEVALNVSDGWRGQTYWSEGKHPTIVIYSSKCEKYEMYSTLAHESVHAINYIFSAIGEESRDEVYAHSIAAIVRAVENNWN